MGRVAITIDDQINKLESRGVNFEGFETQKIKEILLDIGYYRLGFYWHDLKEKNASQNFKNGTKFKTILDLYYLDNDIRYILVKYLNRIEINFRTLLVYYVSNKYRENPFWFVDNNIMQQSFIKEFPNHYNQDFVNKHFVIKNHHKKYPKDQFAPAWKTLENFPFGAIFKIYQSITDNDIKERISDKLGIKPIDKFEKTFNGLVRIRNRCAHGAILYNYYLPKSLPTLPAIDYCDDNRQTLRVVIQVIEYVLHHISCNRKQQFIKEINQCLEVFKNENIEAFKLYSTMSGLNIFEENLVLQKT